MMTNAQKLSVFPKDYHSAFRLCNSPNSPFFRTMQFICLAFQSTTRFLLVLIIPFNHGPELQQTLFPVKLRETLPGFSPLCSGGDPARCLILTQSAQLHWLTEQLAQNFAEEHIPGNRWDLELRSITVNLGMDSSGSSESSFQLVTRVSWLERLPQTRTAQAACECSALNTLWHCICRVPHR